MAFFNYTCPKSGVLRQCSMNDTLTEDLVSTKRTLLKKDRDSFLCIDGYEGSGKSVVGFQICSFMDPTFNLSRVCFTAEEFKSAVMKAKHHESIMFDEAFSGLNSRASLSKLNRMLVNLMMQMRQKNLFVLIVLPSVFLLDRYVALFRSNGLIHCHVGKNDRHMFFVFNRQNKKKLLLEGAKTMDYAKTIKTTKSIYRGGFRNCYANIDEDEYRKKKMKAFETMGEGEIPEEKIYYNQRNKLINIISQEYDVSLRKMEKLFLKYEFPLKASGIRGALENFKKEGDKNEI